METEQILPKSLTSYKEKNYIGYFLLEKILKIRSNFFYASSLLVDEAMFESKAFYKRELYHLFLTIHNILHFI